VPNLGRTAQLVVPRELVAPRVYAHLLSFLRNAPAAQVHALWQCVAETVIHEFGHYFGLSEEEIEEIEEKYWRDR
jgi:hypothetical protein